MDPEVGVEPYAPFSSYATAFRVSGLMHTQRQYNAKDEPPLPPTGFSISWPKNILLVSSSSCASCISVTARSLTLFRSVLYIAMQFFRFVNARLVFLVLSTTVYSNPLLEHLLDIDYIANVLKARQEPGVVATPDFLRRGFHSCKY